MEKIKLTKVIWHYPEMNDVPMTTRDVLIESKEYGDIVIGHFNYNQWFLGHPHNRQIHIYRWAELPDTGG